MSYIQIVENEVVNINDAVAKFGELLKQGLEMIAEAGRVYVQAIDQDPDIKEKFVETFPEAGAGLWNSMEKIGRGQLHYKLYLASSAGAAALSRLPYSDQEKYINSPVELLIGDGDKILCPVNNLTPDQSKQVFASDHIRDLGEQRAYLEDLRVKKARRVDIKAVTGYEIKKGKLIVGDVVFCSKDLHRILGEMDHG